MRQVVILAAGKGTRMNGNGPKVLRTILGKPMIAYILDAIEKSQFNIRPVVVVGYEGEKVAAVVGQRGRIVWQKEQLGTGHAMVCARPALTARPGAIAVLYGDCPLVSSRTIDNLFNLHDHAGASLTMMTTAVENFHDWRQGFYGFGRILRNSSSICGIREMKDCSEEEKHICELNPGYYCFDAKWLWSNIDLLKNDNKQNEYYLTDLVSLAFRQNKNINSLQIHPLECLGVNTPEQLQLVESLLRQNNGDR